MIIGIDAHKRGHQAVAIDAAGRECARWRGGTSETAIRDLTAWATALDGDRRWGIEGRGQYGRGLAQHLVARGGPAARSTPA